MGTGATSSQKSVMFAEFRPSYNAVTTVPHDRPWIKVRGRVTPPDATVIVDENSRVPTRNGRFSREVPLIHGENTITVKGQKEGFDYSVVTFKVERPRDPKVVARERERGDGGSGSVGRREEEAEAAAEKERQRQREAEKIAAPDDDVLGQRREVARERSRWRSIPHSNGPTTAAFFRSTIPARNCSSIRRGRVAIAPCQPGRTRT